MSKKTPGNNWKSDNFTQTGVFLFSFFLVVWPTKKTAQQSPNLWNWSGEGIRGSRETNGDQDTGAASGRAKSGDSLVKRNWSSSTFQDPNIWVYNVSRYIYIIIYNVYRYIHMLYISVDVYSVHKSFRKVVLPFRIICNEKRRKPPRSSPGPQGQLISKRITHEAKQIFVERYHIIATGKKKPEVENYYKLKSEVYNFQVRLSHLLFLESLLGLQC